MPDDLRSQIDALTRLNLAIRHQLELAELRIPEINLQIQALAALGSYNQLAIEGDVILQLPYLPSLGPSDSCQIYEAVLIVPEGIGVAVFDLEDFRARQCSPAEDSSLLARFHAFDESSNYVKACLLSQVDSLVERLVHTLGVSRAHQS